MDLRSPALSPDGMPLSRYVRQELLTSDLRIDPGAIVSAHTALLGALRDPSVPYLVRTQGASGPSSLRGKETDVGLGRPVVFTDNSPAIWLHHRLLSSSGSEGGAVDLAQRLHDRAVPVAAAFRREESSRGPEWPLLSSCMGRVYPPIWTAGWKLSHILPCSPRANDPLDPLAVLASDRPPEFFRLRAIRNLSPYNYFLSPLPRRYAMSLDGSRPQGSDLGEDPRVIDWVIHLLRTEVFAAHPGLATDSTPSSRRRGSARSRLAGRPTPPWPSRRSTRRLGRRGSRRRSRLAPLPRHQPCRSCPTAASFR